MALSVIGAGFSRTGTESMKLALEMLGLGPCHHMKEVLPNSQQIAIWRAIAAGKPADWDLAFAGYNSTVDWPGAYFWRELSEYYPEAKILLTVRSAQSWYASMENTILKFIKTSTDSASLGVKLISQGVFDARLDDRDHIIAAYKKNIAEVQAAFGPERLLTYHLGDGWEPLCQFLDKPVPESPYPQSNTTKEFNAAMTNLNNNR